MLHEIKGKIYNLAKSHIVVREHSDFLKAATIELLGENGLAYEIIVFESKEERDREWHKMVFAINHRRR